MQIYSIIDSFLAEEHYIVSLFISSGILVFLSLEGSVESQTVRESISRRHHIKFRRKGTICSREDMQRQMRHASSL